MANFAFLIELKVKPGKELEVEAFLKKEAALVRGEPGTLSWHAAKVEGAGGDSLPNGRFPVIQEGHTQKVTFTISI